MTDRELLNKFTEEHSEAAFSELVGRYTRLVYSAALRQTGNSHTAEEITQAVFIVLARKANRLRRETVLSGWLLRTTRFVTMNAKRRELTRVRTEQEAMNLQAVEAEAAGNAVAPLLDECLCTLKEKDRNALSLRFFEQKTFKEIACCMGTSEDGAQKRVARALDQLRAGLARRGMSISVSILGAALTAEAVRAATPGAFAAGQTALAVATGSAPLSNLAQVSLSAWQSAQSKAWLIRALAGTAVVLLVPVLLIPWSGTLGGSAKPSSKSASNVQPRDSTNGAPPRPAPAPGQRDGRALAFHVLDATRGTPVPGARLTLTWTTDFPNRATNIWSTDKTGSALLALDRTAVFAWNFRIEVFKDGYVPKYVSWSAFQADAMEEVPFEYTTKLDRAVRIGGKVVDPAGQPVAGADVVFDVSGPGPGASHDRERLTMMGHYHTESTEGDGRWECSHVPAQFGMIDYTIRHRDFAPVRFGSSVRAAGPVPGLGYVTEAELLNQSVVTRLAPGRLVAGQIVDEKGEPVAGAKVTQNRDWREPLESLITGADGTFQFRSAALTRELVVTVEREGFSPWDKVFEAAAATERLRVPLSKGALLRRRMVDEAGEPVPQALVQITTADGVTKFEWQGRTDSSGYFVWPAAPLTELYRIQADGFQERTNLQWSCNDPEQDVVLTRLPKRPEQSFRISGSAVDAGTGKPLEEFRVLLGTTEGTPGKFTSSTNPELRARGRNGTFSFTATTDILAYVLEIEADGYLPIRITRAGPFVQDCQFHLELQAAQPITGVVQLVDGSPARGATVLLSAESPNQNAWGPTTMDHVYMRLPAKFDLTRVNLPHVETGPDGKFALAPRPGKQRILIAHPTGFVQVTPESLAESPVVRLEPWARIEGTVKTGPRPAAGEIIHLRNWNFSSVFSPSLWVNFQTTTDEKGQYAFDGVPPGDWQIFQEISLRSDPASLTNHSGIKAIKLSTGRGYSMILPTRSGFNHGRFVHTNPGQTVRIDLGGEGRLVIGKVEPYAGSEPLDWQGAAQMLRLVSARPPYPNRTNFTSDAAFLQALQKVHAQSREYWNSEAGRREQNDLREYVLQFDAAGIFKVPDVLPGTYDLELRLSAAGSQENPLDRKVVGALKTQVVVPQPQPGDDESPFDLGVLKLQSCSP